MTPPEHPHVRWALEVIDDLLEGDSTPHDFEHAWLARWSATPEELSPEARQIFEDLFWAVEDYVFHRDRQGASPVDVEPRLLAAARRARRRLDELG
ncbi:hypothetical protein [Nocardioides pacificus]